MHEPEMKSLILYRPSESGWIVQRDGFNLVMHLLSWTMNTGNSGGLRMIYNFFPCFSPNETRYKCESTLSLMLYWLETINFFSQERVNPECGV